MVLVLAALLNAYVAADAPDDTPYHLPPSLYMLSALLCPELHLSLHMMLSLRT